MISSAKLAEDLAVQAPATAPAALKLNVRIFAWLLALAIAAVVAASFSAMISLANLGIERHAVEDHIDQISKVTKFLLKFDVGGEQTVSAWLSSMLMLLCALTLFYIASIKRAAAHPYGMHWLVLSLLFLGLSMDEAVGFHEMMINPMRDAFGFQGVFLYAWVVPAIAFVGVVGLAYVGFLLHLEPRTRNRIVLAGGLFVGGAVGFEMLEGALVDFYAAHRIIHEVAVHLEDSFEFLGILIFLHTLLRYTERQGKVARINLG